MMAMEMVTACATTPDATRVGSDIGAAVTLLGITPSPMLPSHGKTVHSQPTATPEESSCHSLVGHRQ